jgi:predicted glycosyltransferase involved in capsule biosynthesis
MNIPHMLILECNNFKSTVNKNMVDLKNVTFLIAIKVDSEDRVKNLDITIPYLQTNFDTNIVLCEQDVSPKLANKYNCGYVFCKTEEFFNRQRGVNLAAKYAKTSIIAHYDADVLFTPNQLKKATKIIMNKDADIVYPYDGRFYDVPKQFHEKIKSTASTEHVTLEHCTLFNPHSVGGAVFFNASVFWEGGGANENFKGLGYEDNEIYTRFSRLGYKFGRVSDPLLHLTHERKDTSYNHNPYIASNLNEYNRVSKLTKEELKQEIKNWNWIE